VQYATGVTARHPRGIRAGPDVTAQQAPRREGIPCRGMARPAVCPGIARPGILRRGMARPAVCPGVPRPGGPCL
jgi:hypothetical protein